MSSHEELYITKILRILLGQSLKISVMVTTTRNNKKLRYKKQLEITIWNSICKTNTNV